ncbi:ABC transporter substrate-binding protein [Halorhabdus sp. SVX81]|uniref:ABC transporter substrate-binding protein n=1 Tax=Halorhabdus sp. SVX81 TaxID=2978283 RepID=UPI0023D9F6D6|nr:ABC transporter substrate-binding protein [Halorhabdus sp. SVX81]
MAQTQSTQQRFELLHQLVGAEWGGAALNALVDGYERRTSYTVEETTTSADDLSIRVKIRILQERAPDAWIEWPGQHVTPYIDSGAVRDITHIWEDNGFEEVFTDGAKEQVRFDGTYHAIPLNIHRINNLFYNVEMIEEAGVDIDANSPRAFVDVLEQLEGALDVTPFLMALRNPWGTIHVWETILLGETDARTYRDVVDGNPGRHRDAIETTLSVLARYLDFANDDAQFASLPDANAHFVDDEGALFLMGDWAASAYDQDAYGETWDAIPFPGTEGDYPLNMDALVPSSSEADTTAIDEFLAYAGSQEAQTAFNRHKGSMPPRTDTDPSEFTPFLQDQRDDFDAATSQPPSIAHGLAVHPETLIEVKSLMAEFVSEPEPASTADRLVDALSET